MMKMRFEAVFRVIGTGLLFLGAAAAWAAGGRRPTDVKGSNERMLMAKFQVHMHGCTSCATHIAEVLRKVDGVTEARAVPKEDAAVVFFRAGAADIDEMRDAVRRAGFNAVMAYTPVPTTIFGISEAIPSYELPIKRPTLAETRAVEERFRKVAQDRKQALATKAPLAPKEPKLEPSLEPSLAPNLAPPPKTVSSVNPKDLAKPALKEQSLAIPQPAPSEELYSPDSFSVTAPAALPDGPEPTLTATPPVSAPRPIEPAMAESVPLPMEETKRRSLGSSSEETGVFYDEEEAPPPPAPALPPAPEPELAREPALAPSQATPKKVASAPPASVPPAKPISAPVPAPAPDGKFGVTALKQPIGRQVASKPTVTQPLAPLPAKGTPLVTLKLRQPSDSDAPEPLPLPPDARGKGKNGFSVLPIMQSRPNPNLPQIAAPNTDGTFFEQDNELIQQDEAAPTVEPVHM